MRCLKRHLTYSRITTMCLCWLWLGWVKEVHLTMLALHLIRTKYRVCPCYLFIIVIIHLVLHMTWQRFCLCSLFSLFLLKCAEGLMRNDKQSPQVAGELFVKAFDPQSSVQIIAVSEQRACVNRVCVLTEICVNINGWKCKMQTKIKSFTCKKKNALECLLLCFINQCW